MCPLSWQLAVVVLKRVSFPSEKLGPFALFLSGPTAVSVLAVHVFRSKLKKAGWKNSHQCTHQNAFWEDFWDWKNGWKKFNMNQPYPLDPLVIMNHIESTQSPGTSEKKKKNPLQHLNKKKTQTPGTSKKKKKNPSSTVEWKKNPTLWIANPPTP